MLYLLSFDTCIHLCNSNPIKIQNITNTPGNAFTIFPVSEEMNIYVKRDRHCFPLIPRGKPPRANVNLVHFSIYAKVS